MTRHVHPTPGLMVIARSSPKDDSRDEVRQALAEAAIGASSESGCLGYTVCKGADCFVVVEYWSDQMAFDEHRRGPVVAQLEYRLAGKLAQPAMIEVFTPLAERSI